MAQAREGQVQQRQRTGAVASTRARSKPKDLTEQLNQVAKAVGIAVLIALLGIGAFGRFYSARFNGLQNERAMEAADVAEQIRSGRGLSSRIIRPSQVGRVAISEKGVIPAERVAPLYPLLLSGLFKVRGGGDASVALMNGMFLFLTGWFVFLIGRALWDKPVGLVAVALYFVSVETIGTALSATGASLAALLLTVAVWAAIRFAPGSRSADAGEEKPYTGAWWKAPLIVGALFGITYIAGLMSLLVVIPIAILGTVACRKRGLAVGLLLLAALVPIGAWGAYSLATTGQVVPATAAQTLMTRTTTYPGDSVFGHMASEVPAVTSFLVQHPMEMLNKIGRGLVSLYRAVPGTLNIYLFPFFILGAFQFAKSSMRRSVWRTIIWIAVLQAITIAAYDLNTEAMNVLTPLVTCMAAGGLLWALRAANASNLQKIAIGVGVFALVAFPTISSAIVGGEMPAHLSSPTLGILRERIADDAVVATDIPEAVARYSYKSAVQLPQSPEALKQMEQEGLTVDYVYLSRAISPQKLAMRAPAWTDALRNEEQRKALGKPLPLPGGELLLERVNKRLVGDAPAE